MSVEPYPDWLRPPVGGYTADDLDRLPDLPPHTELIDGSLVFVSPQSEFHMDTLYVLEHALRQSVPGGWKVWREMNVKLDSRNRPEPDLMIVARHAGNGPKPTFCLSHDVLLAVEVVSEESQVRDRETKPKKFAAAGIRHFWRVESNNGRPVVYVYELDPATETYTVMGIHHDVMKLDVPFPIDIQLA